MKTGFEHIFHSLAPTQRSGALQIYLTSKAPRSNTSEHPEPPNPPGFDSIDSSALFPQ